MEQEYRLGRVAEKVVAATTRPVLIVKPEALLAAEARPIRRLLVPLDGTPKTAEALRPVSQLATVLGAAIDLLYVAAPDQAPPVERGSVGAPRYVDQAQHEWPQWTVEVIERLGARAAGRRGRPGVWGGPPRPGGGGRELRRLSAGQRDERQRGDQAPLTG